jgi:hypothetical protein
MKHFSLNVVLNKELKYLTTIVLLLNSNYHLLYDMYNNIHNIY